MRQLSRCLSAEVCHYNVTWPTIHGCPLSHKHMLAESRRWHHGWHLHWPLLVFPGLSTLLWFGAAGAIGKRCGWKAIDGPKNRFTSVEYDALTADADGL